VTPAAILSQQKSFPEPRIGISSIPAYIPGEADVRGAARVVKLSSNESPLGASPLALAALRAITPSAHLYPDAHAAALRGALALKHGLNSEQIVCSCGSEELLHLVARAFVDTGDEVIVSEYGFISHQIAAMATGATLVKVPETRHHVDPDAMLAAVTESTKLVYIANPGNPTGTMLPFSAIREFHSALPASVVLVVDAAYAEFAEAADGYESGLALVNAGAANVLITRTFSKMYGLAALRIGWGYCSIEMAAHVNRVRPAFNANAFAQASAMAALDDDEFVCLSRRVNRDGLALLTQGMQALGLEVTPSVCNFILVHFPPAGGLTAMNVFEGLRKRGVIVRPVAGYGLPNSLRISIGTEEQNTACLQALQEVIATH